VPIVALDFGVSLALVAISFVLIEPKQSEPATTQPEGGAPWKLAPGRSN
jgi:hypothetical protein